MHLEFPRDAKFLTAPVCPCHRFHLQCPPSICCLDMFTLGAFLNTPNFTYSVPLNVDSRPPQSNYPSPNSLHCDILFSQSVPQSLGAPARPHSCPCHAASSLRVILAMLAGIQGTGNQCMNPQLDQGSHRSLQRAG